MEARQLHRHEQFYDLVTQRASARLGMWVFLGSETRLFAGLFALYVAYRLMYHDEFSAGVAHNNQLFGTINTLVLLTSSLTVALAIAALRAGRPKRVGLLLLLTLLLASAFLVIKGFEYSHHFAEGIYPGTSYQFAELDTRGAKLFFTLYYFMTGLHALHVIAGMGVIGLLALLHWRRPYGAADHLPVELGGLYWHLFDAVWIFLWPLFYLIR
jgi:cytochrome c oxidase subunit 3